MITRSVHEGKHFLLDSIERVVRMLMVYRVDLIVYEVAEGLE